MKWSFGKSKRQRAPKRVSIATTHTESIAESHAEGHGEGHEEHDHKPKALPFLASPVDPEALKGLAAKYRKGQGLEGGADGTAFGAGQTESALAGRIFRKQHEASSIELFFDLFFVANLAVFTTRSAHMDLQSLSNYIGFFSILWTTWFHISMYDVRFYVDCVFTRVAKFLCFGIMVSLVGLGSLYDAVLSGGTSRAFHGIAILMFAARMLWVIQYAVVLYFVRVFPKTLIPMCLTMLVYVASGVGFLATYIKDRQMLAIRGNEGTQEVRIWYGIICAEAILIIAIAMFWRILSFIHTHIVERVGLLSLIIMGEGIIGLVKSTSYMIQGMNVSIWKETGIVAAGVLLIYLMYILYFDNVDHHGFGTIGQQMWTLLHFPTHVGILLTVEGSTALVLWNAICSGIMFVINELPDPLNPKGNLANNDAFVAKISNAYNNTMTTFKYKSLEDYYAYANFSTDLAKLSKPKAAFGTPEWTTEVSPTLTKMKAYFEYFIYQNFGAEGPVYKLKKEKDYGKRVEIYDAGYKFVLIYYYIAAGALLLILAGLFMFGRKKKTTTNWWSIAIRILAGCLIPVGIYSPMTETPGAHNSFRYKFSGLLVPVVALGYFLVIIVDNIAKAIAAKHYAIVEERRLSRITSYGGSPPMKGATVHEEEHAFMDEEGSYGLRRTGSSRSRRYGDIEHGSPQMVQEHDGAGLLRNAQGSPSVSYSDMKNARQGYAQVGQDEHELPEYMQGDDTHYSGKQ